MKRQPTSYCVIGNCPPITKKLSTGEIYTITWRLIRRIEAKKLVALGLAHTSQYTPGWYYHNIKKKCVYLQHDTSIPFANSGGKDNHNPVGQLRRRNNIYWLDVSNTPDSKLNRIKKFRHLTEKKRRGCRFTRRWIKQQIGMIHSFDDAMDNEMNLQLQFGPTDRAMW